MKNKKIFIHRLEMTALLLAVYFLCAMLPIPFVKTMGESSNDFFTTIASINGATSDGFKLFSLGLMPYFMSTLTIKILTQGISPSLSEMSKGTQEQRAKFKKISNVIFYVIAFVQAITFLYIKNGDGLLVDSLYSLDGVFTILSLLLGALLCKYLADKITRHGICNGFLIIIAFMLIRGMFVGLFHAFSVTENYQILLLNILVLVGMLSFSLLVQRIVLKIPVTIDTPGSAPIKGVVMSYTKDVFRINLMCVGITPIIYFSFISPILTAIGILDTLVLLIISLACIYLFTEMSMRSDFNLNQMLDLFAYKGIYVDGDNNDERTMKFKLKFIFNRIVTINTLILFMYYASSVVFQQLPFLNDLNTSGISGIQILMVGYVSLDVFYTVKAYFVKEVPELIY